MIPYDMDLDQFSLMVVCGGDGSYHEAVNGMLARPDGKRLPVGFLPNGSGNDTLRTVGVLTLDEGLDLICNREVTSVDTLEVVCDSENSKRFIGEETETYMMRVRHCVSNGVLGFPGLVN